MLRSALCRVAGCRVRRIVRVVLGMGGVVLVHQHRWADILFAALFTDDADQVRPAEFEVFFKA